MRNPGRSAVLRGGVVALLAIAYARNGFAGSYWFVADNANKVDIVIDDVAVGEVADPLSLFLNVGAVSDVALDATKGVAYVSVESANAYDETPVVVVDLATLTAITTITDPNHLITAFGQTWSVAVSADGNRVFFTNQAELVIADASTNAVTAVVPFAQGLAQGVRLSLDGNTAYVKVAGYSSPLSVSVVDVAGAREIGRVPLPNPVSWSDLGVLNSSSFITSHDGSTLYVVDGAEVFAINTSTLTVTPVLDPHSAIQVPVGLTLAGRNLYVSNRHAGFDCEHLISDVVGVDTATLTVTDTLAIAGDASVWGAVGTSLDERKIYVVYSTSGAPTQCYSSRVTIGILDPIGAHFVGTVSDPSGIIVSAQTAVDPYLGPSSDGSCTTNVDCDDGNACNGAESCLGRHVHSWHADHVHRR